MLFYSIVYIYIYISSPHECFMLMFVSPQGVFRVNLAGTKLKISASSSWKSTGYTSAQHIAVSEVGDSIDRKTLLLGSLFGL